MYHYLINVRNMTLDRTLPKWDSLLEWSTIKNKTHLCSNTLISRKNHYLLYLFRNLSGYSSVENCSCTV